MSGSRPRSAAALVFGSMAPDWAYVFNGSRFCFHAHVWVGAGYLASVVIFIRDNPREAPHADES